MRLSIFYVIINIRNKEKVGDYMRILVVEDEKSLNKLLNKRLENNGFSVVSCYNGVEALEVLKIDVFDVIVMDIMMPKVTGIEVLKNMKEIGISTPVLFLTAKDSVNDKVYGLELGAADYLVKPFSFEELLARIRVILRNKSSQSDVYSNILRVGDLILDRKSYMAKRGDNVISLSIKEFEVLEYLMKHEGEVLSRERIESDVWETEYCGLTNVIDVYIRYLRKKIDDDYDKKLIHTVRGVGYVIRED